MKKLLTVKSLYTLIKRANLSGRLLAKNSQKINFYYSCASCTLPIVKNFQLRPTRFLILSLFLLTLPTLSSCLGGGGGAGGGGGSGGVSPSSGGDQNSQNRN